MDWTRTVHVKIWSMFIHVMMFIFKTISLGAFVLLSLLFYYFLNCVALIIIEGSIPRNQAINVLFVNRMCVNSLVNRLGFCFLVKNLHKI